MPKVGSLWKHFRAGTLRHRFQDKTRRAQWQRLSMPGVAGDFYEDVLLLSGARLRIYAGSELGKLICTGQFELAEQAFIRHFLRPGDAFIDVGANIGLFAVSASRCVGPTGKVLAFEPVQATFARLLENMKINNCTNVHAFNFALSDSTTQLPINTSVDGLDAWSSLVQPTAQGNFSRQTIDAVTWDQFQLKNRVAQSPAALMKIDVEGWEKHVLDGARGTLAQPDAPTLLVEFNDENATAGGWSCDEMYDYLVQLGYHAFAYSIDHGLRPQPPRDAYLWDNLIFTKSPEALAARVRH